MYNGATVSIGVIMPTVYNAINIQSWSTEAQTLSAQKQQHKQVIVDNNQSLIPLQSRLQLLQTQINTIQSQITSYEIRNAQDANYHWQQSHHHHDHHGHHHHHHPLQAKEGRRPRPVVPGSLRAGCFAAGKI